MARRLHQLRYHVASLLCQVSKPELQCKSYKALVKIILSDYLGPLNRAYLTRFQTRPSFPRVPLVATTREWR